MGKKLGHYVFTPEQRAEIMEALEDPEVLEEICKMLGIKEELE